MMMKNAVTFRICSIESSIIATSIRCECQSESWALNPQYTWTCGAFKCFIMATANYL